MFIKQLSIFVENKKGRISEIISVLGENGIDICALSLADTTNFGILRLIVDNAEKACRALEGHGVVVKINHVVGIAVKDEPGGLASALEALDKSGIAIEYMYAFVGRSDKGAMVVLRTDDESKNREKTLKVLHEAGITILDNDDVFAR